jgi:hypothetical protein
MSNTQRIAFTVEALEPGEPIDPEDLSRYITRLNDLLSHGSELELRIADYAAAVPEDVEGASFLPATNEDEKPAVQVAGALVFAMYGPDRDLVPVQVHVGNDLVFDAGHL